MDSNTGRIRMGELIYYVATSIDGFIADRDGGVDWLPGSYADFYASVNARDAGRNDRSSAVGCTFR